MVPPYRMEVFNILSELLDHGLTVVTCTHMERGRQWLPAKGQFSHINLSGIQLSRGRFVSHFNPEITSVLKKFQPDVICVSGFTPTMLLAIWYARRNRIPLVLAMDGWLGGDVMPMTPVHRFLRTRYVPRCATGIAIGEKSREWFLHYGLADEKVFVSPLVPAWPPPLRINDFQERPFDLLWCGHLSVMKGTDVFTEVARRLNERFEGLRVRVVGDGPEEARVRDAFDKNGINAHFDGFLQADQLMDVFSSARVFLFPTRFDPWGLVANEAIQCGTPLIISPYAGSSEDLIKDGTEGFVRELDVEDWTSSASALLSDPERWRTFSRAARKKAAGFSTRQSAQAMSRALKAALSN